MAGTSPAAIGERWQALSPIGIRCEARGAACSTLTSHRGPSCSLWLHVCESLMALLRRQASAIWSPKPHDRSTTAPRLVPPSIAAAQLARAPFTAERRAIDVSGDGTNNAGPNIQFFRDQAVAKGILVNGLVILTDIDLAPFRDTRIPREASRNTTVTTSPVAPARS
jgi:hypothetical protein